MTTLTKPIIRSVSTESAEWFLQNRLAYLATAEETNNEYALVHALGGRNGAVPPHVHSLEDELFIMLKGEATFRVMDQAYKATAGSIVYLPRGLAHQPADFSENSEALLLVAPGRYVDFFRTNSIPAAKPGLPTIMEAHLPPMEDLFRTGREFGLTFLPPGASVASWPVPEVHAEPFHLPAGQGETLNVLGSKVTIRVEGSRTQNLFSVFEMEEPAGMAGPLHIHHADSEAFFVLEGAYEITAGDKTERVAAGSFVYIPKGVPRKRRNYTQTKGKILSITATSGHEHFYREISRMEKYDQSRLEVVGRRYGIEMLGK